MRSLELTPQLLLAAYAQGFFPMAETGQASELMWYSPDPRAVIPINPAHLPKSLCKLARKAPYRLSMDTAFKDVIEACAAPAPQRPSTWINAQIIDLFCELHEQGFAHSFEAWNQENNLVGGLYGLALGRAFFGESMFSRQPNASKLCFVHLVHYLEKNGFELLDAQYGNPHLTQFGLQEIPRSVYLSNLQSALK